MVFESIVTELLNKVLGEYIQNLDTSQLKLSLWGGDVVLNDLLINENALDMLNLPLKLKYGRLGKLVLKIPFKDIWNGQIDAIIEELFILIIPSSQAKYDAEKEEKSEFESKKAELARIEKDKKMRDSKITEKLDDSMMEKLIARMIKNIHIEINRIHVRYEDHVTFKNHPFSIGFTLNRFALESCDLNWLATNNLKDMYSIPQIYKLCTMSAFAIYLNPNLIQFSNESLDEYKKLFSESIATSEYLPIDYEYLVGPINIEAKLKLNPKPETDGSNYTIPKVWLNLEMQKLRIGLTKKQYKTLLQLGEGLTRAQKAAPYKKYRPDLTYYRGNYKKWWHFAYKCILEEEVKRKQKNWDWNHIKNHRDVCREYAQFYKIQLTSNKKIIQSIENRLTDCEKKLDLFNLVIIRQQIEMEIEKLAEKEKNIKSKQSWFGSLFWGSSQTKETEELNSAAAIMRKFEEAMTPQEKEKLYRAIDYQENSLPTHYPETYEIIDMAFYLHGLQIIISDTDKNHSIILDLELTGVSTEFKSRPVINGIYINASINDLKALGTKQGDIIPSLLKSDKELTNDYLFSIIYEKKPLDKLCDDRIIINSKSINIIYDSQTIIELIKLFKNDNETSALSQTVQAVAAERLENFKEMSALGLEYAIQKHSRLDIKVNLIAPQLIIPYAGLYTNNQSIIVINLGNLSINSIDQPKDTLGSNAVKKLASLGKSEEDIMLHLRQYSYDKFLLKISNFQVLVAYKNEDWKYGLKVNTSMSLLKPTTLEIQFHKCLITDDTVLPKIKIIGNLSSLKLVIPDSRFIEAFTIAQSIPLPNSEDNYNNDNLLESGSLSKSVSQLSLNILQELTNDSNQQQQKNKQKQKQKQKQEQQIDDFIVKQSTNFEAQFVMEEFSLTISKENLENDLKPYLKLEIVKLEAEMIEKTFDQEIILRLGGIQVNQYYNDNEIFMINTPMLSNDNEQKYLIVIQYINVDKSSPEFNTRHGSVTKLLKLKFSTLDVLFHQEGLIDILKYTNEIQDRVKKTKITSSSIDDKILSSIDKANRVQQLASIQEDATALITKAQMKKKKLINQNIRKGIIECIDLKINAEIEKIGLKLVNDIRDISMFNIEGISAKYIMKSSYSQINMNLLSINVKDLNPLSLFKDIISVEASESLKVDIVLYNNELLTNDLNKYDISINVIMGCHRVIFLNLFFNNVMNFLNNFQTAQEALIEASAVAAEAAKVNIKDVQSSSKRIKLSINIKAPIIYVPMNSNNEHCLMLDMGNLTINNTFKTVPHKYISKNVIDDDDENRDKYGNENENSIPIVDEMMIELQNLKLSRIKLNRETFNIDIEVLILQPVSFTLLIKRNLSLSWYNSIPNIEMSGKLKLISVLLSKEDYVMIMKVMEENFGEVAVKEDKKTKLMNSTKIEKKLNENKKLTAQKCDNADEEIAKKEKITTTTNTDVSDKVYPSIKFEFIMDSFIIDLFIGGSKLLNDRTSTSPLHLPENSLAKFELTHFALKGTIFTDGLLVTSILLMNCTLVDTRTSRKGQLVNIMERTTVSSPASFQNSPILPSSSPPPKNIHESKQTRSMLDITIRKNLNDIFVDVRIFSFSIIVSMDYLLKIKDFFNIESTQDQITTVSQKINDENLKKKVHSNQIEKNKIMMTINLHIEKPDIILLEDMDNINSNCIIMNTELLMKLRIIDDHQIINGNIKDLSILTGIYNPKIRNETIYEILKPCSISVAGSTPENEGLHVDICCTDIHISVSPNVIEIVNRVIQQVISKNITCTDDEDVKLNPNYDGLWIITPYEENDFWFLKTEVGVEATENNINLSTSSCDNQDNNNPSNLYYKSELCILSAPVILLTLEAGVGNKTLPMLLLQTGIQTNIKDWSTNTMSINTTISLIMAYYNSRLALWEPLIEPVQTIKNNINSSIPWELKIKIQFNDLTRMNSCNASGAISPVSPSSEAIDIDDLLQSSSKMSIDIESTDNIEITFTKTCLQVLTQLADNFSSAIELNDKISTPKLAPYILKNDTGLMLMLDLEMSNFQIVTDNDDDDDDDDFNKFRKYSEVLLESGTSIQLIPNKNKNHIDILSHLTSNTIKEQHEYYKFYITFNGIDNKLEIPVLRADKRYFSLKYRKDGSEEWGIILDVIIENGSTIILLRSILQIYNHFVQPISVYNMTKKNNEVECIGTIQPDKSLNIPLDAVYTYNNLLFFSVDGFMVSIEPFNWKDLQKAVSISKLVVCEPRATNLQFKESFFIKAIGEIEQVYFENTNKYTMSSTIYNINLYPPIYFKNFLPIDVIVTIPCCIEEKLIEASTAYHLPNVNPSHSNIIVKLPHYLEKEWSCKIDITENLPEFSVWSFESFDSTQRVIMDLGVHGSYKHGSYTMALYCPFWMLNKTEMMLSYRKSSKGGKDHSSPAKGSQDQLNVIYHPPIFKGPILFSFQSKVFFGKKKAMVRVEDGEWSEKFPIDVAGSKGNIVCRYNGINYRIGIHNQLTYNSLTKQITFTPYFILMNNADYLIECQEANRPTSTKIKILPGKCKPFWPESEQEKKLLTAMVGDYPEKTAPFVCTDVHTTLLKLNNKFGGINVDIQITESGIYICLSNYSPGCAPGLIINHTDHPIDIWEKGSMNIRTIQSYNLMYYTWENPSGFRKLIWEDNNNKKEIENDLRKDILGVFTLPDMDEEIYYVSFLNGIQRILLFTKNLKIAEDCQLVGDLEIIDTEITLNIHGVGLSLVNNINCAELLYMCIASSGIIWESRKNMNNRWKILNNNEINIIENGYQKYINELQIGNNPPNCMNLESKLIIDYENMEILSPHKRYLRRTFQTGLWILYKASVHQVQLHAKINHLQIDNQLNDCIFPVILAPVPPPKSVTQNSLIKPFAELSMVKRLLDFSTVQQFRYFKVLIQEFHIKVDIGFINALMGFFEANEINDSDESKLFRKDMALVDEPLIHHVNLITTAEQKNFFDLLHFSPLKIHISFSMTSNAHDNTGNASSLAIPQFLNVLLQGIGVTLTDINDIIFKLAYFERDYTFMTNKQLINEAITHYTGQAIKQLYVLVLGLDVIGNPYGLVIGTVKGIEDLFYEPFQGAIQGPGEFAEGLLLGVRSIVGHTVGGMAGAVSKITGAMGKGLATLTFDKDYQRKRQEQLNKQPVNIQEGLARSGKGLVMGVYDGVTGVVLKPISGAKQEGFEGFFKGVGKGVVGLVTRPTAGVIDFASGSFGAVRRATELSEEAKRVRPPRFLPVNSHVKPYIYSDAKGNKILYDLEKGKYFDTDVYYYHIFINKDVLLMTDKRIAYIEHSDLFGGWKVHWGYTWQDIQNVVVTDKGVQINIKDRHKKKKLGGLFGSSDHSKVLLIPDTNLAQLIYNVIEKQLAQISNA